jgi:hypothetical protein
MATSPPTTIEKETTPSKDALSFAIPRCHNEQLHKPRTYALDANSTATPCKLLLCSLILISAML